MQVRLESMNINVPELPEIGRYKVVCGNCHHRGHRNQQTKPCIMERCSSFTYCGIKDKHPEYTSEMNRMKCAIKKKSDAIKQLEEELEGINNFQSQSEHQFIKAFTPRMMKVNPEYKTNRSKLLRDIRILRKFFGGKIPEETTNDPEQLRITIAKCKRTLQDEVGDVGVLGIVAHERRQQSQSSGHAAKFNVNMNLSPVKNNGKVLTQKQNMNTDFIETKIMNNEQNTRQKHSRANKGKKKRKRKGKSVYHDRSSSNSELSSSSSVSSRSSSSDCLHSRKKPKKASTRRKLPYNEQSHSITGFTHFPVQNVYSQQPFYENHQMGTFPMAMHMLPAYNYFGAQSSSIPHSTLEHSGFKQQTLELNTATGDKESGQTTVNEETERPYESSPGLDMLSSAAYFMQDKH